jgi:hypothetical protein
MAPCIGHSRRTLPPYKWEALTLESFETVNEVFISTISLTHNHGHDLLRRCSFGCELSFIDRDCLCPARSVQNLFNHTQHLFLSFRLSFHRQGPSSNDPILYQPTGDLGHNSSPRKVSTAIDVVRKLLQNVKGASVLKSLSMLLRTMEVTSKSQLSVTWKRNPKSPREEVEVLTFSITLWGTISRE